MTLSKLILSIISVGACSTPALADTLVPYVGAIVGYDHVKATLDPLGTASKDGVIYGGMVGADYVFRGMVLGVEGEITGASTKETVTDGVDSASVEAGRDLYAGVRSGYVIAPHVLAYAKIGYTNARFSGRAAISGVSYRASQSLDGWRLGGGVEGALQRFRVRLEYRYSDYGQLNYQGFQTGVNVRRHQVVLGALIDL